ncbi:MAG TPA: hypothetical protein VKQ06_11880 [Gammaproteobacteria bacterium]|nr:hypothetical protein [Gammaproteobacteria bacterium]
MYRRDLADYPRNGWSYFGLAESLTGLGKESEADQARATFEQIWSQADVTLTASRI